MVSNDKLKIVREWTDARAPTGEGHMYQTEDGCVWQSSVMRRPAETGMNYGVRTNGEIRPEIR